MKITIGKKSSTYRHFLKQDLNGENVIVNEDYYKIINITIDKKDAIITLRKKQ